MAFPHTETHELANTINRLQVCASMDKRKQRRQWLSVLGMSEKTYQSFLKGQVPLPDSSIISLARYLGIDAEDILKGSVDYRAVAVQKGGGMRELPEPYAVAAFSRRRTTITSFDYIEKHLGWQARAGALRHLNVNEAVLADHMAPINTRFFTDAVTYLRDTHGLSAQHIFEMGVHSSSANRNTLIGTVLSSARNVGEAYLTFVEELLKFFEHHSRNNITFLGEHSCIIEATPLPYIAEAMGTHHLGSWQICAIRVGVLSSIPCYLNLPLAKVSETLCVHRGDKVCRFEIEFPHAGASTGLLDGQH